MTHSESGCCAVWNGLYSLCALQRAPGGLLGAAATGHLQRAAHRAERRRRRREQRCRIESQVLAAEPDLQTATHHRHLRLVPLHYHYYCRACDHSYSFIVAFIRTSVLAYGLLYSYSTTFLLNRILIAQELCQSCSHFQVMTNIAKTRYFLRNMPRTDGRFLF